MNESLKCINSFDGKSDNSMLKFNDLFYRKMEDVSDGSRVKIWVVNKDGERFLYKENKKFPTGKWTFENISEYLAYLIGVAIEVPCVSITCGDYAVLSKVESTQPLQAFVEYSEELQHSFHMSNLATFNISTLLDRRYNIYFEDVVQMLFFDILIGNSDRHPGNFMHVVDGEFYPLFDNGSSLCSYVEDDKLEMFLQDSLRYKALLFSKSRPVLRTDQKLTHYQLLSILRELVPTEFSSFKAKLNKLDPECVLDNVAVTQNRRELLLRFLTDRKAWFYE